MQNLGEEICGEYLSYFYNCQFLAYNIQTKDDLGEIDVIGINIENNSIYCCEVAVHTQGFGYVKDNKPNDYERLTAKFSKDLRYLNKNFPKHEKHLMFWSPIVKSAKESSKYNCLKEVLRFQEDFLKVNNIHVELIINQGFQNCLNDLRKHSVGQTKEFKSNVMRLLQIEEALKGHLKKKSI